MFVTSKTQTEGFVVKWQIDNFGALFLLKIKIKRKRKLDSNTFKGKITLSFLRRI